MVGNHDAPVFRLFCIRPKHPCFLNILEHVASALFLLGPVLQIVAGERPEPLPQLPELKLRLRPN